MRGRRFAIAAAALTAIGLSAGARAATVMVVRASGPSEARYPAGRLLDDAAPIVLQEGDELTILDGAGTRELTGPVRLRNAGARLLGADAAARLSRMLSAGASRRNVAAGTRDAAAAMSSATLATDNLWTVDLDGGGNWCVPQGTPIRLSRQDRRAPATLTIAPMGRPAETLRLAAGQARLEWEVAPVAGASLTVRIDDGLDAIGIRIIPDEYDEPMPLAEILDANRCDAQLAVLASRLR